MKIWQTVTAVVTAVIALAVAILATGHLLAWTAAIAITGAALTLAEVLNRRDQKSPWNSGR